MYSFGTGRAYNTIQSADEYVGNPVEYMPVVAEESSSREDIDFGFSAPEESFFRHVERRVGRDVLDGHKIAHLTTAKADNDDDSTGLHRTARVTRHLHELGRRAKESLASFVARRDSKDMIEGTSGLLKGSSSTTTPAVTSSQYSRQVEQYGGFPLDTLHIYATAAHGEDLHLGPDEAGEVLAARLNADMAEDEFEAVRAGHLAARQVETGEEEQWDASYDFLRESLARRAAENVLFKQSMTTFDPEDHFKLMNEQADMAQLCRC